MVNEKLIRILNDLTFEELQEARNFIEELLRHTGEKYDHRAGGDRFKTRIAGVCIIEREREFFNQEHKIEIIDISPTGLRFQSSANIIHGDILQIFFRSPLGKMKEIYAEAVRTEQFDQKGKAVMEIGARSVDYKDVIDYRRALVKGKRPVKK
ncbi:MAG: hypothetical protein HZA01_01305 [Nitrospinae bacterium]|nr:hypothetical protein [Nitrospinota bacterium]